MPQSAGQHSEHEQQIDALIAEYYEEAESMRESASRRSKRERQVDALIAEFYEETERGTPPDEAQFLARHPEFVVELREFFADLGGWQEVVRRANSAVPLAVSHVGLKIRDYRILEQIGEGGMGTVYRALHTRLDKTVALKIIQANRQQNRDAISRFEREMRAVGKLEHPNIIRALDAGEEQGRHFLVMEYIAGFNLSQLVHGLHFLSLAEACELARQAALGLHHAHENNVVHRDVKPSNLMLSRQGQVKVLDLGLAQFQRPLLETSDGLSRDGDLIGTLLYMAPEQLTRGGQVDARTDIYCLGVTLCELLAGDLPRKHGHNVPLLTYLDECRIEVPAPLLALLESMLSNSLSDRPRSMAEVARQLEPHAAGANPLNLLERLLRSSPAVRSTARSSAREATDAPRRAPLPAAHVRTAVVSESDTVPEAPPPAPPLPPPVPPPIVAPIPSPALSPIRSPIVAGPAMLSLISRHKPWTWLALWGAALTVLALGVGYAIWEPISERGADPKVTQQKPDKTKALTLPERSALGPSERQRFDIVALPQNAGAETVWGGSLVVEMPKLFNKPVLTITIEFDVTLWAGEAKHIDGVTYRPLVIEIASGPPLTKKPIEKALLWIDEHRYRKDFLLVPHPELSFVEIGGEVFPFNRDSEEIVGDLERLGKLPGAASISIYDALAMLFDADLIGAKRFGALRKKIAAEIIAKGHERERDDADVMLPDGTKLRCEVWQPPLVDFTYRIHRTRQLPFGIYRVYLAYPAMESKFSCEVKTVKEPDGKPNGDLDKRWTDKAKLTADKIKNLPPLPAPPPGAAPIDPPIDNAGKPGKPPAEALPRVAPMAPSIDAPGKPDKPALESLPLIPPTDNSTNSVGLGPSIAEALLFYFGGIRSGAREPKK